MPVCSHTISIVPFLTLALLSTWSGTGDSSTDECWAILEIRDHPNDENWKEWSRFLDLSSDDLHVKIYSAHKRFEREPDWRRACLTGRYISREIGNEAQPTPKYVLINRNGDSVFDLPFHPDAESVHDTVYSERLSESQFKILLGTDRVIRQETENGCVAAAVTMLIQRSGYWISEQEVKLSLDNGPNMTSLSEAKQFMEAKGFAVLASKTSLTHLKGYQHPFLAYLTSKHLVVINGVYERSILVLDPAVGRYLIKPALFEDLWSGVIMRIEPANKDGSE
jgi:hypothetical protein